MTVSENWTEPSVSDLATDDLVEEVQYDAILSDLLYLGRSVEPSLTNKSGGIQVAGAVVLRDASNDSAFTTTAVADAIGVAGIVMDTSVAINAAGRVRCIGLATVNVQGNITRGNYLSTSTTAGRAKDAGANPTLATFAIALTGYAGGGAGTVTALLLPTAAGSLLYSSAEVATAETTASTSFADLATPGPSVTINVGPSGAALVIWVATEASTTTQTNYDGVRVDSTDPTDAQSASHQAPAAASSQATVMKFRLITGLSAGSHTFKMRYRTTAGTGQWSDRYILAIAL